MFMAATLPYSITILIVSILAVPHLQVMSKSISKPSGFSLELIHRDSPHSPLYPGNLTQLERVQRLIQVSKNQVAHLQSMRELQLQKQKTNSTYHPTIISSLIYQRFLYLVALTLGTPPVLNHLLLDTGSDFIWTQCQPLRAGFPQTPKVFDPRASTTYRKLPCSQCLHPGFQCIQGECVFATRYLTGARAKGIVSVESFGFLSRVKGRQQVNNIIFGCANDNTGFTTFSGTGILGLNKGTFSLLTQLGNIANKRFSHCLSRVTDPNRAPTYLRFGTDIPTRTGLQSTPLVPYPPVPGQFAVNLIDVSIGNRRLGFPPGTFAVKPDGKGGCLVDSGTAVSHMIRGPYEVLKNAVVDYFRPFRLGRKSASEIPFDLCYQLPTTFRSFPRMTFHFQGADLHVREEHAFFISREQSVFCLAMMAAEGFSTLGAFQQQNTRFIYDVGHNVLSFVPEDCIAERA